MISTSQQVNFLAKDSQKVISQGLARLTLEA